MNEKIDLMAAEAVAALQEATAAYRQAVASAPKARRIEADCLNRLNRAQKQFDETVAKMKNIHKSDGSDWARARRDADGTCP